MQGEVPAEVIETMARNLSSPELWDIAGIQSVWHPNLRGVNQLIFYLLAFFGLEKP